MDGGGGLFILDAALDGWLLGCRWMGNRLDMVPRCATWLCLCRVFRVSGASVRFVRFVFLLDDKDTDTDGHDEPSKQ